MLIPSIDLQNGAVVQLVQGERLAIRDEDVFGWVRRFEKFPKVQVIDLDAAMSVGDNLAIVRQIAPLLSCRVGGGVRTVERARELLAAGAKQVIVGSSLFKAGKPNTPFARELAEAVGADKIIAAVDSKGGHVVIHGWKTALPLTAVDAVKALEPFCSEFLYTHVDAEGLMKRNRHRRDPRRPRRHHPARDRRRRHHDARRDRRAPQERRGCCCRDGAVYRAAIDRRGNGDDGGSGLTSSRGFAVSLRRAEVASSGRRLRRITGSDLFFVTLEKAEDHYSPTTMYRDYAVSPDLFHWESQSTTSVESPTGRRYLNHSAEGTHVFLFVRHRKHEAGRTAPYTCLGAVDYVSHKGSRPIAITWRLRKPMPEDFFREAKLAAG